MAQSRLHTDREKVVCADEIAESKMKPRTMQSGQVKRKSNKGQQRLSFIIMFESPL